MMLQISFQSTWWSPIQLAWPNCNKPDSIHHCGHEKVRISGPSWLQIPCGKRQHNEAMKSVQAQILFCHPNNSPCMSHSWYTLTLLSHWDDIMEFGISHPDPEKRAHICSLALYNVKCHTLLSKHWMKLSNFITYCSDKSHHIQNIWIELTGGLNAGKDPITCVLWI